MKTIGTILLLAGFFLTLFTSYQTVAIERQDGNSDGQHHAIQWVPALSSVMIVVGVVIVVVGRRKQRNLS